MLASMARTTIAVETATRDALMALCASMGSASMDEAVRVLIFEHECAEALSRLDADPAALADYRAAGESLAEVDVEVQDQ
jgi:hypothetical protein